MGSRGGAPGQLRAAGLPQRAGGSLPPNHPRAGPSRSARTATVRRRRGCCAPRLAPHGAGAARALQARPKGGQAGRRGAALRAGPEAGAEGVRRGAARRARAPRGAPAAPPPPAAPPRCRASLGIGTAPVVRAAGRVAAQAGAARGGLHGERSPGPNGHWARGWGVWRRVSAVGVRWDSIVGAGGEGGRSRGGLLHCITADAPPLHVPHRPHRLKARPPPAGRGIPGDRISHQIPHSSPARPDRPARNTPRAPGALCGRPPRSWAVPGGTSRSGTA
jgi:hypothetical protein